MRKTWNWENGTRYGRLTIISDEPVIIRNKSGRPLAYLKVRCDCGNKKLLRKDLFRDRDGRTTRSCGCLYLESRGQWGKHHGAGTRIYAIWKGINSRCNNPNVKCYPRYGGRGIKNLFPSFEHFRDWSLKNGYARNLSIDRIDPDGNYESTNCRWATASMQSANQRRWVKRSH